MNKLRNRCESNSRIVYMILGSVCVVLGLREACCFGIILWRFAPLRDSHFKHAPLRCCYYLHIVLVTFLRHPELRLTVTVRRKAREKITRDKASPFIPLLRFKIYNLSPSNNSHRLLFSHMSDLYIHARAQ